MDNRLQALYAAGYEVPTHAMIKTPAQIEKIRQSAKINIAVLDEIEKRIHEGMKTSEIDQIVYDLTTQMGGIPAPLDYKGYPYSVCTSVNDQVCHGFPSEDVVLRSGDIVNVDCSTILDGYFSDSSRMFCIGEVSPKKRKLVEVTRECVELGLKEMELKESELVGSKITPTVKRADRGEVVTVTVTPKENYRVKTGTLKAVITDEAGNTTEVFMSRQNDSTYTFDLPSDIDKNAKISFTGEFEPGQYNNSDVDTSLGAGIAVTVSNSETRADIKGAITSAGNVKAAAAITGGVKTEAKAGYSKGNTGLGGAVAVQVASMDSKALVHKSADLKLDGKLIVDASAEIKYTVNADASGSKEAEKTGVGAGIAVAVNGADTFAIVQDGTTLAAKTEGGKTVTTRTRFAKATGEVID